MNNYLIPANTKRGSLIFSAFRPIDLIILGVGILITLVLLFAMPMNTAWQVVLILLPALVCAFLVIPIPNYHNMMTVVVELYTFLTNRQKYIWKGWCVKDVKEVK